MVLNIQYNLRYDVNETGENVHETFRSDVSVVAETLGYKILAHA